MKCQPQIESGWHFLSKKEIWYMKKLIALMVRTLVGRLVDCTEVS